MATLLQLDPQVPVAIVAGPGGMPTGKGRAIFLLDYGPEEHILWAVSLDDGGAVWWVPNPLVRLRPNPSLGREDPA
jgi:hypothetical protein